MENGPFIDDFPIKTFIYKGFSMAMLNNQMVIGKWSLSRYIRVTSGYDTLVPLLGIYRWKNDGPMLSMPVAHIFA